MMTVGHMREAWTHALSEIDAAIAYLEVENAFGAAIPRNAAEGWLVTLYRDRTEYRELLVRHPLDAPSNAASH